MCGQDTPALLHPHRAKGSGGLCPSSAPMARPRNPCPWQTETSPVQGLPPPGSQQDHNSSLPGRGSSKASSQETSPNSGSPRDIRPPASQRDLHTLVMATNEVLEGTSEEQRCYDRLREGTSYSTIGRGT